MPKLWAWVWSSAEGHHHHFANLKVEDIDYWELIEAFAAQIIGCNRELKIPLDKMNINGGGISLVTLWE